MITNTNDGRETSRREFLKTSAVLGGALMAPAILTSKGNAAENTKTIRIALVGCGGRGTGAANQALSADKNVVITVMADAFQDRLDSSLETLKKEKPDQVKVDPANCFVGLDAYKKVMASDVDVVLLTSPPGFRPIHLKAAVEANKHIFTEKPMAVDGPGVRSVLASVEEAKKRNLSLVDGFCWRYNWAERAAFQKIHEGAIGDVRTVYGVYNVGELWSKPRQDGWTDLETQMRNWLYHPWLSGDHLVEQAVHTVDKMCWAMNDVPPVKAIGHGGRQVRTGPEFGNVFDHFAITYEYASGARNFVFTRQQTGCAADVSDTIYGTKGVARIRCFAGMPFIKGETNWVYEGERPDMYQVEHNELFASIRAGKPINSGVRMAHSTLTAIMGRMAAYTGQEITWEQALNSQENLWPGDLAWNMKIGVGPVPVPGKTQFS